MTDHAAQLEGLLRGEEEEVVVEDASKAKDEDGGGKQPACTPVEGQAGTPHRGGPSPGQGLRTGRHPLEGQEPPIGQGVGIGELVGPPPPPKDPGTLYYGLENPEVGDREVTSSMEEAQALGHLHWILRRTFRRWEEAQSWKSQATPIPFCNTCRHFHPGPLCTPRGWGNQPKTTPQELDVLRSTLSNSPSEPPSSRSTGCRGSSTGPRPSPSLVLHGEPHNRGPFDGP